MSDLQVFTNGIFKLEVTRRDDSFTVQAPSLARQLGFRAAFDMIRNLPDDEKGCELVRTPGGTQEIWHVTEPGLYRVLGQRQLGRVPEGEKRNAVKDFQDWVFKVVIPGLRRAGEEGHVERGHISSNPAHVMPQPRNAMEQFFEPNTYTWEEVAALIHQRTGIPLTVNELTRMLRTGGVLKQTGAPTKKYRHMFWFTGSSWSVHPHVIPEMTYKVFETGRELQDFRFIQARLELEGVGQSIPSQRQPGMRSLRHG